MDAKWLFVAGVWVVAAVAVIGIARWMYYKGRFYGMQEGAQEMSIGMSGHYEREGEEFPELVTEAIDRLKERVSTVRSEKGKGDAYRLGLSDLARAIGNAVYGKGFDDGCIAREGEVRIDFTTKELADLSWMAHYGFENMMPNYMSIPKHRFENEENALAAARAIDKLEGYLPKEFRDPGEPYAIAGNRQQLIWEQWPSQ